MFYLLIQLCPLENQTGKMGKGPRNEGRGEGERERTGDLKRIKICYVHVL